MVAKAKAAEKTEAGKDEKKARKRSPLFTVILIVLILLVLLVLGAGAAVIFLDLDLPFVGEDNGEEVESPPRYSYAMPEFQVNLADAGTRRFLRTTIELAYDDRALTSELDSREAELRSEIISLLRSKHTEDLEEPGGQKSLEQDLLDLLNGKLNAGEVRAIYFRQLIFQ